MVVIPGYQVDAVVYTGAKTMLHRGYKLDNQTPVLIKTLSNEHPTFSEIAKLKYEYEIIKDIDINGVIKLYKLENYNNRLALILENFEGESLKQFTQSKPLTIVKALQIAIQILEILDQIHHCGIIHKDIKLENIIINPKTEQLKIIDFFSSSRLIQEIQPISNPQRLEGTLAYISPEQTGRMNRSIDYRSDFYSLGVTLYELLTNQLPFTAIDAMELVHCHIAKLPTPPHIFRPEIGKSLSNIVLKLLAKTPEERYQSTYGIKADLQLCLTQLLSEGEIKNFTLGQQDVSQKILISQKLYGRELEIQKLITAFERVTCGRSEITLVSGYSGVGKSALVQEIYKPVTRQKGFFISGKCDQFQRNIPYTSLLQAFRDLTRQILMENDAELALWREKILSALGTNGQVLIDVLPELELIVGEQPVLAEVTPVEAQNRFNLILQNFIQVFTQPEHPLVIFLDDLQWSDLASLNLLQLIFSDPNNNYLFLLKLYPGNLVEKIVSGTGSIIWH
jgi:serine/threonine protein kinase